jgi:hypothetical protein
MDRLAIVPRLLEAIRTKPACTVLLTRQPTIRRAQVSPTDAT